MFIALIIFSSLSLFLLSFLFSLVRELLTTTPPTPKLPPSFTTTPGPTSYPFIGCLISFYQNRHRLLSWYTDLLADSPSQTITVNRLGARRTIVTANPTNVEYILKTNFNNFPKGKPFTDILGDLLGCGIFNVDGQLWSAQRKLASHEFTTRTLRQFVLTTLEKEVSTRLIPLLENACETKEIVDLQDLFKRFAFDVICKVSLGRDPKCLDPLIDELSEINDPLVKAFDSASAISAMRSMAPIFLAWKIKRFLNIGSEKKLKEAVALIHGSVVKIVRNKRLSYNDHHKSYDDVDEQDHDFLSRLIAAGHDEEVVRDMVISFVMAGRDTTSSALTWLFWLLAKNPNVEKMIANEVNNSMHDHEGSLNLGYEELRGMNYLKACLCESMRLYPPVVWDSKHADSDDILPDGTPVKRGDRVTYFPYGMGRMQGIWGKDCPEFRPDRWFDGPVEDRVMKLVSPFEFPVFQAGPRVCLGKEMAFIQMKYVVAKVLRRFEMRLVDSEVEPVFVPLLTAHMAGGLKVMVRKRRDNYTA